MKNFLSKVKSFLLRLSLIGFFFLLILTIYLDSLVKDEFDQQAWDIPAKVYARSLSFSLGQSLVFSELIEELKMLGYRKKIKASSSGEYERYQQTLVIYVRPFKYWDGQQTAQLIQITIENNRVTELKDFSSQQSINYLRLDPLLLGDIQVNSQGKSQDRQLVQLEQLPSDFVGALLVTEDRAFYDHIGISFKGIARAFWNNLNQGQMTQGGSTLTQQLMKNHFLSSERSLFRKGKEAIMAVLTEVHYEKDTILQAYVNEVYLGQSANTAIHGFARASEFYFDRSIEKLELAQTALLVGMVKGPSFYNPRRHPERAKQRRDLVLAQMLDQNIIDQKKYQEATSKTLMVVAKPPIRTSRVPSFMGLVKRELSTVYSAASLKQDGLKLFTSLDPVLQKKAESALKERVASLDPNHNLQGAILVSDIASGEVQAMVGDRQANYVGFNRAMDAYRQTGSVIKPFVYLAALQHPDDFNLTSPLSDQDFSLTGTDGSLWSPKNYDKENHGDDNGQIELGEGLINSYNLATARLAIKVGIDSVTETIIDMGYPKDIPAFPSIALGSKEMSPFEVLTLYQALANQGTSVKPQGIIAVQDQYGNLLTKYPKNSQQVIAQEAAFIVKYLLTQVTQRGTAKSLSWQFPKTLLAGKTGTTNDLRDSWYAGFDNNKLAVVWLGRDDNQPTGLTGASGALKVWSDLFNQLPYQSIDMTTPNGIQLGYSKGGFFSEWSSCTKKELKPFYYGELPEGYSVCEE
jgi:penicillin-binding protein 1B